jgi:hypothetical protein
VVHYGSEYTLIGFKGCSGGRFSADPAAEDPKAVDGAVIEFELEEDPELIRFALSEVAYANRPLERRDQFPSGFETSQRVYFSPSTAYSGSVYFAMEFTGAISTYGMSPAWSHTALAAGDGEFYANFDKDQGFFANLSGHELRDRPFERIVISRTQ